MRASAVPSLGVTSQASSPSPSLSQARLRQRLLSLFVVALVSLSLSLLQAQSALGAPCAPPTPLQTGDVVHVAVRHTAIASGQQGQERR